MDKRKVGRWAVGAVFAGACIAMHATRAESAVNPRIQVIVANSNNCRSDGTNYYIGEAWAYDAFNNKTCEVFTGGVTAMSTCAATAYKHEARITKRAGGGQFTPVSTLVVSPQVSPPAQVWGNASQFINYVIPANGSCPNGSSLTVYSQGLEGASYVWPP